MKILVRTAGATNILLVLFGVVCLLFVVFFVLSPIIHYGSNTNSNSTHLQEKSSHSKTTHAAARCRYHALCMSHTSKYDIGWEFAGPATYIIAQFGNNNSKNAVAPKLASAAAIQNVVEAANHTWFISSVNGGVWKSTNLQEEETETNHHTSNVNVNVHWENVLDGQVGVTCTSMAALHVSMSNPTTIYAGCGGSTSGEQGYDWNVVNSGDWNGIIVSTNLGTTWTMMDGFPENFYVTDIMEMDNDDDDDDDDDSQTIILVAAQSHLWDKYNGGIWRSNNNVDGSRRRTFERVCSTPTFTLTRIYSSSLWKKYTGAAGAADADADNDSDDDADDAQHVILATHAHSSTHTASISTDRGITFVDMKLPWSKGAVPFYTCATQLVSGTLVIAGLTRLPGNRGDDTSSQIFVLNKDQDNNNDTWIELEQPMRMDQDGMPKDRMALLADPIHGDLLYVAGNAGALAWRVNITTGAWTKLWGEPDVMDGSIPHGDCRNFAWDQDNNRLLLVTDGGIFARIKPREPGGRWISLNGDYSALELISAHYDPQDHRYVAGAQDNCAIVTKSNATPKDVGFGFVMGDGTVTMVDSQAKPSRLFGTTQFLGVGTIENDPKRTSAKAAAATAAVYDDDDDDDGCGGLCFAQGEKFIQVEVDKYFPEPSSFPFFVHPYTLNVQDPTLLHFWTNASLTSHRPSAFYEFSIPYTVKDKDDIGAPTKLLETPPGAMVMAFVSGGYTNGTADPNLLIGISNTHLYVRSLVDKGPGDTMVERPLPMNFAAPVTLEYDYSNNGARILGPLTHAKTVSMSISPSDSRFVVVTGWPSVKDNLGDEAIFVTMDAGQTWQNVTGNLREASGVAGKVRPGGLLLMDLPTTANKDGRSSNAHHRALLVGTSNGIMTTFISSSNGAAKSYIRNQEEGEQQQLLQQQWTRLGTCKEFPIVLVADIDHEPISDRLVAATYGRGIYILKDAKRKLLDAFANQLEKAGLPVESMSSI